MPDSNYDTWKHCKVSDLATRTRVAPGPEEAERRTIYSLALMDLTLRYWNGNKYGRGLKYPLNEPYDAVGNKRADLDYLGHNIAAFAVDGDGLIIDFAFNHNELYNSSVEHAEARLIKRIFSLSQIHDSWETGRELKAEHYASLLTKVSVYTTLESCAQCSGIMALGKLKEVIYLQEDPGQYHIGNIMWNMTTGTPMPSPDPIAADSFGFEYFKRLNDAYVEFQKREEIPSKAMVLTGENKPHKDSYTKSITSFLCTASARTIYKDAAAAFKSFVPKYPSWPERPADSKSKILTNEQVLAEARSFVEYSDVIARRSTAQKL